MCFVRGDPRTADYTLRFYARRSAPAVNDNLGRAGRAARRLKPSRTPVSIGWQPPWGVQQTAIQALAIAAVAAGIWLATIFVPMLGDVFG